MADSHHTPAHGGSGGYEKRDVNLRAVLWSGVGFALLCLFAFTFVAHLFHRYNAEIAAAETPQSTLAERDPVPDAPRLLVNGPAELAKLRAYEANLFNGYGWVQPAAGLVRIPVARALQLVAERGLPTWPTAGVNTNATAATNTPAPAETKP